MFKHFQVHCCHQDHRDNWLLRLRDSFDCHFSLTVLTLTFFGFATIQGGAITKVSTINVGEICVTSTLVPSTDELHFNSSCNCLVNAFSPPNFGTD